MPRLRPALAVTSSWTSSSGSRRPISGCTSTRARSGIAMPSARPSSPTTISATSAFGPCPAPVNFTT